MLRKLWAAMGGLSILVGCVAPTESLKEMELAIQDKLAQGPDEALNVVQATTGSVPLAAGFEDALRNAVLKNHGYRTAQALEAEAFAAIEVASSARRPQLSGNAMIGGLREGQPVDRKTTGAAGDVTLSQLLYDGGASEGAISGAQAKAFAVQADRIDRGNMIALEAARAWLDLWLSGARLNLLQRKTEELTDLMDQMERMAANGLLDRASVDGARRQHLDIQLERTALEANRTDSVLRFERYFSQRPTEVAYPKTSLSAKVAQARAPDWKNAPILMRTIAELFVAKAAVKEARAAFQPVVSLQAGVVSPMERGDSTDVRAGFRLQYVFNDGGRRAARLDSAEKRVDALEAQFTETQKTIRSETGAALIRLAAIDQSKNLVEQQIRLSASEARIARSQITTGQANLQQLVTAEIAHYRAADQLLQMRAEHQTLLLDLAARMGYLTETIGLTP